MTTINNSDDLLRLLREDPHFYQEARRLILTDELIALPERFAALAARVDAFITKQEKFNAEQLQFNAEQLQFNEEQRQFNAEQLQFNEEQRQFNRQFSRDLAELKGNTARYIVQSHCVDIASFLGFVWQTNLTRTDLINVVGHRPQSGLEAGDWISFVNADLVIRAVDGDNHTNYIAVEASYTADARDTSRAIRNAGILQSRTGSRSHAVIASLRKDNSIAEEIDAGAVHWYEMDPAMFTPT